MVSLSLADIGRAALDLLYPPRCVLCGRGGVFLCARCTDALPRADGHRCDVCWSPFSGRAECPRCVEHPLALSRLRAAFRYEGDVRRLVHAFKFRGQSCLAPSLGAPMLDCARAASLDADVIVPVPLTGLRRRRRGHNQAALLARELGRGLDLPVSEALRRTRFPRAQARSASAIERRRNVEGAFAVARTDDVVDRRVLIVDDITTTGATLDACARALLAAGASDVLALTLARED